MALTKGVAGESKSNERDEQILAALRELKAVRAPGDTSSADVKPKPHWMVQAAFGIALASALGAAGSWFDLEATVAANRSDIQAHRLELAKREAPVDSIQLLEHRVSLLEGKTSQLEGLQEDVSLIRAALCQHPEFKISGCTQR